MLSLILNILRLSKLIGVNQFKGDQTPLIWRGCLKFINQTPLIWRGCLKFINVNHCNWVMVMSQPINLD